MSLIQAVKSGDLNKVKQLLHSGQAKITEQDQNGNTALLWAAYDGHLHIAQWLLREGGAKITEREPGGYTALLYAVYAGRFEIVKWFLREGGAKITERSSDGNTALLWAAHKGHFPIVQWLVEEGGAKVSEVNKNGRTALEEAKLALEKRDRSEENNAQLRAIIDFLHNRGIQQEAGLPENFIATVESGDIKVLSSKYRTIPNVVNLEEKTGLIIAIQKNHLDMISYLIDKMDDKLIAKADRDGKTAVHYAIESNSKEIIALLKHKISSNQKDKNGNTFLMQAIAQKKDVVAKYLIENFSDMINSQNDDGDSPLILAARIGNKTIIDALLKAGARLELRDTLGRSALRAAIDCNHVDIATFFITALHMDLTEKNKLGETLLIRVSRLGRISLLNLLLTEPAVRSMINAKEIHDVTALMAATQEGHEEVVHILCQYGASINMPQEDGITPLMFAAGNNHVNLVKYLVDRGADVNATDAKGNTALTYATYKDYREIIQFLRLRNARITEEFKPTVGIDAKGGGYKILSIDGGGIRGIVAACILKEIERRTKKHMYQLVDLIAGTSTGGIIALGLTAPHREEKNKPLFTADEILEFYKKNGEKIFSQSSKKRQQIQYLPYLVYYALASCYFFSARLERPTMITLASLVAGELSGVMKNSLDLLLDRYSREPLENLIKHTFGTTTLNKAMTNVLITAYDVSGAAVGSISYTRDHNSSHHMYDVALGTSAAPTYFPAFRYEDKLLIDGGVYANNPALEAYLYAKSQKRSDEEIIIISIGTGQEVNPYRVSPFVANREYGGLFLVKNLIDILMKTSHVDKQMKDLLGDEKYWRLQVNLERSIELDSISPEEITYLIDQSEKFIRKNDGNINRICELLDPSYVKENKPQIEIRCRL